MCSNGLSLIEILRELTKPKKPLGHADTDGWHFSQDMLCGDSTAGIDFDRLQFDAKHNHYYIFEHLKCSEEQLRVTPHTSHPKYYWNKDSRKFISLFRAATKLEATLYLVNYALKGTPHEDKVRVIRVDELNNDGIKKELTWETNREKFQIWFRTLNRTCFDNSTIPSIYKKLIEFICDDLNENNPQYNTINEIANLSKDKLNIKYFEDAIKSLIEITPLTKSNNVISNEFVLYYLLIYFINRGLKISQIEEYLNIINKSFEEGLFDFIHGKPFC